MGRSYKDFLSKKLAPSWLQQPYGSAFLAGVGDALDSLSERIRLAVKARFSKATPYDGLIALADERGIERGVNESTANWRERVRNAWNLWIYAGTAQGLLQAFRDAGVNPRPLPGELAYCFLEIHNGYRYWLDENDALHQDANGGWNGIYPVDWSAFGVMFAPADACGLTDPGDATAPISDTSDPINLIRRLILKWKPAHSKCVKLTTICFDGVNEDFISWGFARGVNYAISDATPKWGDGHLWGAPDSTGNVIQYTPPVG